MTVPFSLLDALAASVVLVFIALHVFSAVRLVARLRGPPDAAGSVEEPVSIIVPIVGLSPFEIQAATCVLDLNPPAAEILFCAFEPSDPAAALIFEEINRRPGCAARLLFGRERHSANPKMDNVEKGFAAAAQDMVICVDGNVALRPGILIDLWKRFDTGAGMVSSPPLGTDPDSFWADVECAVLNANFARWQLAADTLDRGFANGKLLMMRKSLLAKLGGVSAFSREIAEDAAATKFVRGAGLRVSLVREPVAQPLGKRSAADVWRRNLRWARLRRRAFPSVYAFELSVSTPVFLLAVTELGWASGLPLWQAPLGAALGFYAFEACLTLLARWPFSPRMPFAFLIKDVMMLAVWTTGWFGSGYVWRGVKVDLA